jgi:hypothetical protein
MLYYPSPTLIQTAFFQLSSDISTTSTSFVDMTGVTLTVNTDANTVQCCFCACMDITVAADSVFQLMIDGVAKRGTHARVVATGYGSSASLMYRERVSVGQHVIKMQWRTTSGTLRIRPTSVDWESASLMVEELAV